MIDILRVVLEAERKAFPVLSKLSENDIDRIWTYVSAYIERQMTLHKGVHVAGLGTFTFSQQKLDMGNKFIMIQRPIFLLAEKLAHSQGLKQARPLAAAMHVPVVQLNYTAVSRESPFNHDVVEGCVRETMLLFRRALASKRDIFFTFQGIGVLYFKDNKVRMKFNREFINAIDSSGRLLAAFSNRVGSSASLMSGGLSSLQRPQTADPITLPSVCSPQPGNKADGKDGQRISSAADGKDARRERAFYTRLPINLRDDVPQLGESKSHQLLQPVKMKGVSLSEEHNPKTPMEAPDKAIICISPPEGTPRLEESQMNVCCSGPTHAGQELCYLCMQRAMRNVPLYVREERLAEDRAEGVLLLFEEQQRDRLYLEKEQANMNKQREQAKQVVAFNLEMSEAQKKEKAHCPPYHASFIFPHRPLTPVGKIEQHRYKKELQAQAVSRRQRDAQDQQTCLLLEHIDQIQLAKEIALQKAQQLQQKQERAKLYKRALDVQVEAKHRSKEDRRVKLPPIQGKISQSRKTEQVEDSKSAGLPEHQPNNSRFGRVETPVINAENRARAQKVFQEQLTAATQKKREQLRNRQAQQKKEKEMLDHNRREHILDRITSFEKKRNERLSLEDEWRRSANVKRQREDEEKRFLRSDGKLLMDQFEQYRRCYQCKRKTSNHGESNIHIENCIPVSHLMIS